MLFVWGKRTYGAVHRVDNIAIKTVFGHLWYLPLFPMTSFYVDVKADRAFELNSLNWRSVALGYLRVWIPVIAFMVFFAVAAAHPESKLGAWIALAVGMLAFGATYIFDRKLVQADSVAVRKLMGMHFGVALDPYICLANLQQEIDAKAHAAASEGMDNNWYKAALNDAFVDKTKIQLAVLRARCDQHDESLQDIAIGKLAKTA